MMLIRDVHIERNNIHISDVPDRFTYKNAIDVASMHFPIQDIRIVGNKGTAKNTGEGVCAFVFLSGINLNTNNGFHGDIFILDNEASRFTAGVYCRASPTMNVGYGRVEERGNRWKNLTATTDCIAVGSLYHSETNQPIHIVCSKGQHYHTTDTSGDSRALRVEGPISTFECDDHGYTGTASFPASSPFSIDVSTAAISRCIGRQVNTIARDAAPPGAAYMGASASTYSTRRISATSDRVYTGSSWLAFGAGHGATAERPTLTAMDVGYQYFDTDLAKYIGWSGTAWMV